MPDMDKKRMYIVFYPPRLFICVNRPTLWGGESADYVVLMKYSFTMYTFRIYTVYRPLPFSCF